MHIAGTLNPLQLLRDEEIPRHAKDLASSLAASVVRGGGGAVVVKLGRRPVMRLRLYEMEGCPYSRLVRESLSMLDLDADVVPCPEGAAENRAELIEAGGEETVPFLVDPNRDRGLYDSTAIIQYLFEQYGDGSIPPPLRFPALALRSSKLASAIRGHRGKQAHARAKTPERPLELWGYEASAETRLVREKLSELALRWTYHNRAPRSPRREAFEARTGRMQFPYLRDPNTERAYFDASVIGHYLDATYAA